MQTHTHLCSRHQVHHKHVSEECQQKHSVSNVLLIIQLPMNQHEFDLKLGFNSQRSTVVSSTPKYPAWASNPTSILFNGYWKAISQVLKCQYQEAGHSSMWTGLNLLICTSHISCKWNVHHPFITTQ